VSTYREAIAALALRHGISTISDVPGFATVGGGERGEIASETQRPGTQHTTTIEEPPADAPPGEQLPLI